MSEAKGIKEITEVLEGLKLVGVTAKKVSADGKFNFEDAGALMNAAKDYNVLVEAIAGVNEVPAEVKDLSVEELQAIGAKVIEIVNAIKAA